MKNAVIIGIAVAIVLIGGITAYSLTTQSEDNIDIDSTPQIEPKKYVVRLQESLGVESP